VRSIAWDYCGILRNGPNLKQAIERLSAVPLSTAVNASRSLHELRNMHVIALLIARCAEARQESRGGHYRTDYPEARPEFQKHSRVAKDSGIVFA
jgi:L-aspartate oxidase